MDVVLQVNGVEYSGWVKASVTRSLEAIAGSFELEVSEPVIVPLKPWTIQAEDVCMVGLKTKPGPNMPFPVITGFVDQRSHHRDAESHRITIAGRDRTGVLVDCSVQPPWHYKTQGVLEVCQALAGPYGVPVALQDGIDDAAVSTTSAKAGAGTP